MRWREAIDWLISYFIITPETSYHWSPAHAHNNRPAGKQICSSTGKLEKFVLTSQLSREQKLCGIPVYSFVKNALLQIKQKLYMFPQAGATCGVSNIMLRSDTRSRDPGTSTKAQWDGYLLPYQSKRKWFRSSQTSRCRASTMSTLVLRAVHIFDAAFGIQK